MTKDGIDLPSGIIDEVDSLADGWIQEPTCPACGNPIDYCQGHGEIGDPVGHDVLYLHDEGYHRLCHANADCHAKA